MTRKVATAAPDEPTEPKRGRGRPRKNDGQEIGDAFLKAQTADDFVAIARQLGSASARGKISVHAADSCAKVARLALAALKAAITERAAQKLAEQVLILTQDEYDWLNRRRAALAPAPLKPGEGVPIPEKAPAKPLDRVELDNMIVRALRAKGAPELHEIQVLAADVEAIAGEIRRLWDEREKSHGA